MTINVVLRIGKSSSLYHDTTPVSRQKLLLNVIKKWYSRFLNRIQTSLRLNSQRYAIWSVETAIRSTALPDMKQEK